MDDQRKRLGFQVAREIVFTDISSHYVQPGRTEPSRSIFGECDTGCFPTVVREGLQQRPAHEAAAYD
jgi:hypothetical protein